MSRTRIVKGSITKITGGNHNICSRESSVNYIAGGKVTFNGEKEGILYTNNPVFPDELFINNIVNCYINFLPCTDYMKLTKEEKSGDVEPDQSKIYGFDRMLDKYKEIYGYYVDDVSTSINSEGRVESKEDKNSRFTNLEKEYDGFPITWKKDKKYYTPWLSIYNGQTIRMRIELDWDEKPQLLRWDEDYKHSDKLILPEASNIQISKKIQDIEIQCIAEFDEPIEIRLLADDALAGRLRIVPNKQRTLNVTWCLVDIAGKNKKDEYKDIEKLKNKLTQQKINRFVKYSGLSQALVNVETTETYKVLKLSDWKEYNVDKFTKKDGYTYNGKGIIDNSFLKNACKKRYEEVYPEDENNIVMFLVNYYRPKFNVVNKVIIEKEGQRVGGESFGFGNKFCLLYSGFDNNFVTVVHEILHCLSLYHSFDIDAKHKFKAYETENFMDYAYGDESDNRKMLWKWQWERIWSLINSKSNEN